MHFEYFQEFEDLETQLHRTLDRDVFSQFYEPLRTTSYSDIFNALHTFTEEGDDVKGKCQT